jgi:serine/threonine protein phosphatase 1
MAERTFAFGDIHGELSHLQAVLAVLPALDPWDTLLFLGDLVDRGPDSAKVVELVRALPSRTAAKVIVIRGSHEDAWVRVRRKGNVNFVIQADNGCYATYRSFAGKKAPRPDQSPAADEYKSMLKAAFFPDEVIAWFDSLPWWYEDAHAIYVHAGLPFEDGRWLHPREVKDPKPLAWQRSAAFFRDYVGKRVVFGHTNAKDLPQELSIYTPHDKRDMFFRDNLIGIDTGCGDGGFLTAVELPGLRVYESRRAPVPPR